MTGLIAAVADIGSPFDPAAGFPFKVGTDVVTNVAGAAQGVADEQFPAGILFPAFVSADTEVIGVIKAAPVPGISDTVAKDLFRDGGRILTEVLCKGVTSPKIPRTSSTPCIPSNPHSGTRTA